MPTFDSEHYHLTGQPNPNFVAVAKNGELLPKVIEVLELMARERLALATGHSSSAESLLLIREAKKRGIDRIIVTHPMNRRVSMSIEQQREAAKLGAFLEYPYNILLATEEGVGIEPVAKAIRAVGPQYCVLSSDLGQVGNAVHTDGLLLFVQQLRERGFTVQETDQMTKQNPAKFLGLD
jgi:predicted metal-dependent phosphotriesterase family hydrolase